MADNKIDVGGRLHSIATGNILAGADEILDDNKGKKQNQINADVSEELNLHTNRLNALTSQNYVTVEATNQTTAVTDILPATGAVDTVYRVGKWNGEQYTPTVYSEYAWDGNQYKILDIKEYGIDNTPTPSSENMVRSGGVYNYGEGIRDEVNNLSSSIGKKDSMRKSWYSSGGYAYATARVEHPFEPGKTYLIKVVNKVMDANGNYQGTAMCVTRVYNKNGTTNADNNAIVKSAFHQIAAGADGVFFYTCNETYTTDGKTFPDEQTRAYFDSRVGDGADFLTVTNSYHSTGDTQDVAMAGLQGSLTLEVMGEVLMPVTDSIKQISDNMVTAKGEVKDETEREMQDTLVENWEVGSISAIGQDAARTDRMRTVGFREVGGVFHICIDDTKYLYSLCRYQEDGTFIDRDESMNNSGAVEYEHYGKIRVLIRKVDGSDFTGEENDLDCRVRLTLPDTIKGVYERLHNADVAETAARALSDNSLTAQIKATNDRIDELTFTEVTDWVQGWIGADGTEGDTGTNGPLRIRSGFYQVKAGDTLVVKFAEVEGADIYQVMPVWYDTQKVFVTRENTYYSYEGVVPDGVGYVKFVLKRKSNTALSPVTYDGKMLTSATLDEDTPVVVETDPQVTLETGIPLYWREEIDEKSNVQKTIEANLGEQAQSFVFITDMHMDSNAKNSAALVGGILRRTNVNKVVFGGDVPAAQAVPSFKKVKPTDADELASDNQVVRNNMKQEFRDFQQLMKKVAANGGEYYPVHGNHDILQRAQYTDTTGSWQTLPWDEVSHIMMDILPAGSVRQSVNDNGSMYYYVDDYLNKTRMVVLDSFNNGTDISQSSQPSSAEITWLQQVIASVPQGWAVNIMNHAGIDALTNKGYSGMNGLATAIYDAVSSAGLEDKVTIVNGHHHHDAVTHKGGTWQVAVMSDARFGDAVKRSPVHQLIGVEYANSTTRGEHNTTEHAFDIFNTDYTNGLISVVRVGSGNGGCRYIHTEPLEVSAGSTFALTKDKIGAVTAWGCYDNEGNVEASSGDTLWTFSNAVGTVSNGTFSALSAGESIVVCADANGNTEYWCVRVNQ